MRIHIKYGGNVLKTGYFIVRININFTPIRNQSPPYTKDNTILTLKSSKEHKPFLQFYLDYQGFSHYYIIIVCNYQFPKYFSY